MPFCKKMSHMNMKVLTKCRHGQTMRQNGSYEFVTLGLVTRINNNNDVRIMPKNQRLFSVNDVSL